MIFADAFTAATARHGPLCVGIDPHPGRVPALFGGDTPEGLGEWGQALVEIAAGRAGIVKPQAGLFERHGPAGMEALQTVTRAARDAGLLVIIDAKRGDIGSTAEGYAAAYLGEDAPFPAHCITVNPYMGLDTLEPFVRRAETTGSGLAVLARTSNPGAADFQALSVEGAPLYLRVAEALQPLCERLASASGWSNLMIVAGATGPDEARALRRALPTALFLVPGYGTQGAGAKDALAGFVPDGQSGTALAGGAVNASRSVTFPPGAEAATTRRDWAEAIAAAIDAAQADLTSAAATP
ncbi:MAG: orotidine-5'-phosphate decarboxylase [Pseudomonadota bacterium]